MVVIQILVFFREYMGVFRGKPRGKNSLLRLCEVTVFGTRARDPRVEGRGLFTLFRNQQLAGWEARRDISKSRDFGSRDMGSRDISSHDTRSRDIGSRDIGSRDTGSCDIGPCDILSCDV